MLNILLGIVMAVLPAAPARAGQLSAREPDKHTSPGKLLPLEGAGTVNSCAVYGPGFVKVAGTDTGVKIGGAVSIGAGTSNPGGWR